MGPPSLWRRTTRTHLVSASDPLAHRQPWRTSHSLEVGIAAVAHDGPRNRTTVPRLARSDGDPCPRRHKRPMRVTLRIFAAGHASANACSGSPRVDSIGLRVTNRRIPWQLHRDRERHVGDCGRLYQHDRGRRTLDQQRRQRRGGQCRLDHLGRHSSGSHAVAVGRDHVGGTLVSMRALRDPPKADDRLRT
jgi:hypothetical protein